MYLALLLLACRNDQTLVSPPEPPPFPGVELSDPASPGIGWTPGAEVPGWEDYPCELQWTPPDDAEIIQLTDVLAYMNFGAVEDPEEPFPGRQEPYYGQFFAGAEGHCEESRPGPRCLDFYTVASDRIDERADGLGWYWASPHVRDTYAQGLTIYGPWEYEKGYDNQDGATNSLGKACFSRIRPDQIRAFWYVVPYPHSPRWTGPSTLVYELNLFMTPHAAVIDGELYGPESADAEYQYVDGLNYDNAWPWDDITDPDVRRRLYEAYKPLPREE